MNALQPTSLADIQAAQARLAGTVLHTPLVRFNFPQAPGEIYLKLENLQPVGSFKLRAAGNAMLSAERTRLADGVWTASAGNMAQAVCHCSR
jgi:threonine dehydratase